MYKKDIENLIQEKIEQDTQLTVQLENLMFWMGINGKDVHENQKKRKNVRDQLKALQKDLITSIEDPEPSCLI